MSHTVPSCPPTLAVFVFILAIGLPLVPVALTSVEPAAQNGTSGASRIIGGFVAEAESTRHQISLRVKQVDDRQFGRGHICGGSLISQKHVLTAAHCLVDVYGNPQNAEYYIVVGGHTERLVQTANTFSSLVEKVIIHENYDDERYINDIGLLHLASSVPETHATLQPIDMVEQTPAAGTNCQATGWGTTVSGVQGSSESLMAVNITIIATVTCNSTESYDGEIQLGMVCAGVSEGGKDSCQGDSGGPLVCSGLLAGTVSFGNECGLASFPGVYADVAFYRDWIEANGGNKHLASGTTLSALLLLVLVHFQRT